MNEWMNEWMNEESTEWRITMKNETYSITFNSVTFKTSLDLTRINKHGVTSHSKALSKRQMLGDHRQLVKHCLVTIFMLYWVAKCYKSRLNEQKVLQCLINCLASFKFYQTRLNILKRSCLIAKHSWGLKGAPSGHFELGQVQNYLYTESSTEEKNSSLLR